VREDINNILNERGVDALLLYSDSVKDENMFYLTKFIAPDPFIYLKKVDCEAKLVVNPMEYQRAKKESIIKDVESYLEYSYSKIVKSALDPKIGVLKFLSKVVEDILGKGMLISVPPGFPLIVADELRKSGLTILPMFNIVEEVRATKETEEIDEIHRIQRINEEVTSKTIEMISNSKVGPNNNLITNNGGKSEILTVETVKIFFEKCFLERGLSLSEDIIVACGPRGSDPHYSGYPEDKLKANQPIVMDIFPRCRRSRYWTDMTRTIVKGRASKEVRNMFEVVFKAKNISMDAIEAGVQGSKVHNICCDIFEKHGYHTNRSGKQIKRGFIHSLGHGVGLQIHEHPSLSEIYTYPLKEHNIVTVEPGLYDPDIGGMRIEDIIEVKKGGINNLTKMETLLEI
jgi:Xaa-Pro aminopeptidase